MSSFTALALRDEIQSVLTQELHLDVPSTETDLIASGIVDSLALVELVMQLEQRYDVEINLDELDLEVFRTVTAIALFICQLRHDTAAPLAWESVEASL